VALEIRIDRERCMASGNCVLWAPDVFDQDDEALAIVIDPDGAPEEEILTAARNCPTRSIAVVREGVVLYE
jgi:ferredoxin